MSEKQIFTALEVSDHEVRLVVGEFFNTRFNIIKVERIPCFGITYNAVKNSEAVTEAIRKGAADIKKMIGADVKKVLLAIPSYRFRKHSVKVTVPIEGLDKAVTVQDVRNAVDQVRKAKVGKDLILLQPVCVKYTVNGITSRRIPLGEHCSKMTVDMDLLCGDMKYTFDLVTCVEKAGLQVLDIFPDIYCVSKEAALFEQSVDRQIVVIKMEREVTTLGLLRKGRMSTTAVMPAGLGTIADAVSDKFGIRSETAAELMKYSIRLDTEKGSDNPVHIWSDQNGTHTISEQEFKQTIQETLNTWLDAIDKTCMPILQAGETTVIITGEGGETSGLDTLVHKRLNTETRSYIPETLGGRNAGLTAALGLFYAYQDKSQYAGAEEDSIDLDAFEQAVTYRETEKKSQSKEDTLTNKLKGLFLDNRK